MPLFLITASTSVLAEPDGEGVALEIEGAAVEGEDASFEDLDDELDVPVEFDGIITEPDMDLALIDDIAPLSEEDTGIDRVSPANDAVSNDGELSIYHEMIDYDEALKLYCPDAIYAALEIPPKDFFAKTGYRQLANVEVENLHDEEKIISWESSDPTIATVDDRYWRSEICDIIACSPGTTTIKATSDQGRSATLEVTVEVAESLLIDESNFPDAAFRNFLLGFLYRECGLTNGNIASKQEVAELESLDFYIVETDGHVDWHFLENQGVKSLKGIEYFTGLKTLKCPKNELKELDLSNNPELLNLHCYDNKLTSLNISNCPKLEVLFCYQNQLSSLDLSHCQNLYSLDCYDNRLTSLDISACPRIRALYCQQNQLSAIDVSHNPGLGDLYCENNNISRLDISVCSELIECFENGAKTYRRVNGTDIVEYKVKKEGIDYTASGEWWSYSSMNLGTNVGCNVIFNGTSHIVPAEPASPTPAPEDEVTYKGGVYKLNATGKADFLKPAKSVKSLTIPATVTANGKKYKVVSIAKKAFYKDKKLTSISIGSNVQQIGDNAFNGCVKLKSVKGGTALKGIGNSALPESGPASRKSYERCTIQVDETAKMRHNISG